MAQEGPPPLDVHELETILQTFNKEQTKIEVCRQIKAMESTIEEESIKSTASMDG